MKQSPISSKINQAILNPCRVADAIFVIIEIRQASDRQSHVEFG